MALKSSSNTTIPPSYLSETTTTALRNASFSSYFKNTENRHIHSLNKTPRNLNYHHRSPNPNTVEKEDEIDVFPADKYFNGLIHHENTIPEKYQTDQAMISLSKLKLRPRTPSIPSESSWNSQSALLRPPLRNPSRNDNIRGKKSSFLSCYCWDKKSVDVESDTEFRDRSNSSSFNDECNRGITTTRIKTSFDIGEITRFKTVKVGNNEEEEEEERRRKTSLEVFGSNNDWPKESKRFNTLPWDTPGLPSGTYDDIDSDASSDLFELECLSCTANPVDPAGFIGSSSPTTGYAPSEASIDWSVITASVADFSDQASTITSVTRSKAGPKSKPAGILSGCKSQKAVMVAGDAYRSCDKRKLGESRRIRHRFSDSFTRFQGEGKLVGDGISQFKRKSGSDFLKHF